LGANDLWKSASQVCDGASQIVRRGKSPLGSVRIGHATNPVSLAAVQIKSAINQVTPADDHVASLVVHDRDRG
jgi:hypothetical protein